MGKRSKEDVRRKIVHIEEIHEVVEENVCDLIKKAKLPPREEYPFKRMKKIVNTYLYICFRALLNGEKVRMFRSDFVLHISTYYSKKFDAIHYRAYNKSSCIEREDKKLCFRFTFFHWAVAQLKKATKEGMVFHRVVQAE